MGRGGSRIFFRRGCTRLLFYFNTNKPHSFLFFCRIPVVLENRRSSRGRGGGGWCAPPASDNRWTIRATEWTPKEWTSKQGRPKTRWRNDLTGQFGPVGLRLAKHCRHLWDQSREGFLCQESIQTRQTLMMTMNGSYETTSGDCTRWSVCTKGCSPRKHPFHGLALRRWGRFARRTKSEAKLMFWQAKKAGKYRSIVIMK